MIPRIPFKTSVQTPFWILGPFCPVRYGPKQYFLLGGARKHVYKCSKQLSDVGEQMLDKFDGSLGGRLYMGFRD